MIFVSDNCTKEKPPKYTRTLKAALMKKYRHVVTESVGKPEMRGIDKVYKAWKEDFYGEEVDYLYMRVWFEDWTLTHQVFVSHPDWVRQYQSQTAGQ